MKDGRWWCKTCRRRISVTVGTIFHHTKTPLPVWFAAAWHMTAPKNGVSAKTLHRLMGFGSYETAWAMLHRFRGATGYAEHNPWKWMERWLAALAKESVDDGRLARCSLLWPWNSFIPKDSVAVAFKSFPMLRPTPCDPFSWLMLNLAPRCLPMGWLRIRWRQEMTIFRQPDLYTAHSRSVFLKNLYKSTINCQIQEILNSGKFNGSDFKKIPKLLWYAYEYYNNNSTISLFNKHLRKK